MRMTVGGSRSSWAIAAGAAATTKPRHVTRVGKTVRSEAMGVSVVGPERQRGAGATPTPLKDTSEIGLGGLDHVLGGGAFLAFDQVELDLFALGQRPESIRLNGRVVHEAVARPVLWGNESEALAVVELLNSAA